MLPQSHPSPIRRERPTAIAKLPTDPGRHDVMLTNGREVRATKEMGSVMVGDPGVVIDRYVIEGRPGYTIIFRSGFMDGFSPDEVDMLLDVTDLVHAHMEGYKFRSAVQANDDFQAGRIWARSPRR